MLRNDVSKGVQCAQLLHAAGESFTTPNSRDGPTYAVALECSQRDLIKLEQRLLQDGIPHVAIREPDPPFLGELMAIGIQPDDKEKLYPYTKRYKLIV